MRSAVTKGSLWLPLVFSAALAAGGCASVPDEAVQQDLAQMRRDLDALNLALHRSRGETETVLSQLERRTREQSGESARQLSAMNARIDGLTAEMNRLSARLDGRRPGRAPGPVARSDPIALGRSPLAE